MGAGERLYERTVDARPWAVAHAVGGDHQLPPTALSDGQVRRCWTAQERTFWTSLSLLSSMEISGVNYQSTERREGLIPQSPFENGGSVADTA